MLVRMAVLSLLSLLAGCASLKNHEAAPVVSLSKREPVTTGFHTVLPGETLYAIAWEYGHDYRSLARANRISAPYVIYPGQKINLHASRFQVKPQYAKATIKPTLKIPAKEIQAPTKAPVIVEKPSTDWHWPHKGKIVKTFSTKGDAFNKGVDIAGKLGDPIKAAQSGKVVYSGTGLRGYGQLVIVKHNDTFLSAYAHNSNVLVKEGDHIQQGQVIANMGQSDTDNVKLHFEIRKNGQPVDPLSYLSKA